MGNIKATTFKDVFAIVILLLVMEQIEANCRYGYYRMEGHRKCTKCPDCPPGEGLNMDCNFIRSNPPKKAPQCMVCLRGTFSAYPGNEQCYPCKSECDVTKHENESVQCTRYHDRQCQCKSGYEDHPVHGGCVQCCKCDADGRGTEISKCPPGKHCGATGKDGKCDEKPTTSSTTSATSTSSAPITIQGLTTGSISYVLTTTPAVPRTTPAVPSSTSAVPRTTPAVPRTTPAEPIMSSKSISPWIIATIICVVVTAFLIVGVVVFCKRINIFSGLRTGSYLEDAESNEMILPIGLRTGNYPEDAESNEEIIQADLYAGRPSNLVSKSVLVYMSQLNWNHKDRLEKFLDPREEGSNSNWLHIGEHIAGDDEVLRDRVKRCHMSYYGGGAPSKEMFAHLATTLPDLTCMTFIETARNFQRYDVAAYFEKNDLLNGLFSDLTDIHKLKMADLLDKRVKNVKDWRAFANKFGFSDDEIKAFAMKIKEPQNYSPTREMINVFIQNRPELTIQEFQNAAEVNHRNDVKLYLDEVVAGT